MATGGTVPVFDQRIPGFVAFRDNGDGTFSERVALVGGLASPPTVVDLYGAAPHAPGSAALVGPWVVPNDGRTYWLAALWAQVGPGTSVSDNLAWIIEDAGSGATLAFPLQAVRQSTTFYTNVAWSGLVPLPVGQRLVAVYANSSGAAVSFGASAVIYGY